MSEQTTSFISLGVGSSFSQLPTGARNPTPAEHYFNEVISNFLAGDVRALLSSGIDKAGPILMVVCNGMDTLGGIWKGFNVGVGERFKAVARELMNCTSDETELLYDFRCDITHEGRLAGIAYIANAMPNDALFTIGGTDLLLHVHSLANRWLGAISLARSQPSTYIKYYPDETQSAAKVAAVRRAL